MTKMDRPITVVYDFKIGNEWIRRAHTSDTYEEYHRVVRVLHENEDHYKVISVSR